MTDDFSAVPSGGCNSFNSATSMYHYANNIRQTYTNFGGKWVKTAENSYYSIPDNVVCVDVSSIDSNATFEPVYMFFAYVLVFSVIGLFWYVIRRLLLWRI